MWLRDHTIKILGGSCHGNSNNWKLNTLDLETLASVEGGGCSWGGFAKQGVATGVGNGLRLGIKTRTWQGAVAGAAGGDGLCLIWKVIF